MNDTITARQLRQALYHLDNQKMTVEELRKLLFDVNEQDAQIEIGFSMWRGIEKAVGQGESL